MDVVVMKDPKTKRCVLCYMLLSLCRKLGGYLVLCVMCFVDHEALVSLPTPVHIWWTTPKMLVLTEWMEESWSLSELYRGR